MPSPGAANGMDPFDMYTGYAPTPIFNVEAGYHTGALSITLSTPAGFDIYYTLDGYTPTEGSTLYTGPIDISSTTVVRAIAFDPNDDVPPSVAPSFVATNTYFLGADATPFQWFQSVETVKKMARGAGRQRRVGPSISCGWHILGGGLGRRLNEHK